MKAVYKATRDETPSQAVWLRDEYEYMVIGLESNPSRGIKLHLDLGDSFGWFDAADFRISDGAIPRGWCCEINGQSLLAEPVEFLQDGFWERFYDGGMEERETLQRVLQERFRPRRS